LNADLSSASDIQKTRDYLKENFNLAFPEEEWNNFI